MHIDVESWRPRTVLLAATSCPMSYARMPKLLADASLRVSVMAPADSPALASSFVSERLPFEGDAKAITRRLRSLLLRSPGRFDWVILCDEDLVSEVAQHLDEPWAARCFPVSPGRPAQIIGTKTAFIAACQEAGISVPASRVCQRPDQAWPAAAAIGFPLLVKADFGASGTTVWRVDDSTELAAALPRAAGRPFLLQQLLVGEPGVTEMLCVGGRPLAVVSSVMRGIDPMPFGPASSRLYRRNPEAEALAIRIAGLTGFNGWCGFDWVRCDGPFGSTHAIEFHPRPTLGFHMAGRAGVDFSATLKALLAGASEPAPAQADGVEVACLFFPKDLTRALRKGDLRGLLQWLPGRSANDFPWRDPGLMGALARRAMGLRLRRGGARRIARHAPRLAAQSTAFRDDA